MAGFHHPTATPDEQPPQETSARSTRYGWVLFGLYAVLYGGFVLINAFAPEWMQRTPLGGINLAVLYGLGLIVAAFVIAILYDWLCRLISNPLRHEDEVRP